MCDVISLDKYRKHPRKRTRAELASGALFEPLTAEHVMPHVEYFKDMRRTRTELLELHKHRMLSLREAVEAIADGRLTREDLDNAKAR